MSLRYALAAVAFVIACGAAGTLLSPHAAGSTDYVEYGAAARQLLAGKNPYDARALLTIQRDAGWEQEKADMMWNPPWVFPIVLPFGLLPWSPGLAVWVAVQVVAVTWACRLAWRVYGGPVEHQWPVALAVLIFPPTFFLLLLGQISGLLLLGLCGFLAALRANRPALAGVAIALTAIKPHLFLPLAVLLGCEAARTRSGFRTVLIGAGAFSWAGVFPTLWNPHIWSEYLIAVGSPSDAYHYSPSDWAPPTLPYQVREFASRTGLIDSRESEMLVQFGPSVVCTLALLGYWAWRRHRGVWDWPTELPRVVLLCVLTTGYGAWGFDIVVLLLPVVQAAAWLATTGTPRARLWAGMGYLAFTAAVMLGWLPVLWWAPVVAVGYVAVAVVVRTPWPDVL